MWDSKAKPNVNIYKNNIILHNTLYIMYQTPGGICDLY